MQFLPLGHFLQRKCLGAAGQERERRTQEKRHRGERGGKTEQWTRAEGTQLEKKKGKRRSSLLVFDFHHADKATVPGHSVRWAAHVFCCKLGRKLGQRGSDVRKAHPYFTIQLGPSSESSNDNDLDI